MNFFVLHNIRSSWNVGAIMRTADALSMQVIMVGYTSKPIGKTLEMIKKTAIGAEKTVPWEAFDFYTEVLSKYPAGSNNHFGIEISENSKDIYEYLTSQKSFLHNSKNTFLWLGNEISGLEVELMCNLTQALHLKMLGSKESLNVANCACAAGYLLNYLTT